MKLAKHLKAENIKFLNTEQCEKKLWETMQDTFCEKLSEMTKRHLINTKDDEVNKLCGNYKK